MEVFIRGVPARDREQKMAEFFQKVLDDLGLEDWSFRKISRKPYAKLIFLRRADAEEILAKHARKRILSVAIASLQGGKTSNRFALQSLEHERKSRAEQKTPQSESKGIDTTKKDRVWPCISISCGLWEFIHSKIVFMSYFTMECSATMAFKSRSIVIETSNSQRLVIPYPSIEAIAWNGLPVPNMVLTLHEIPRFSRQQTQSNPSLAALIADLLNESTQNDNLYRVPGLNEEHDKISGGCNVYRIVLADRGHFAEKIASLEGIRNLPTIMHREVHAKESNLPYTTEKRHFQEKLLATSLPFPARFQVTRLVQNFYLPPRRAAELLPAVELIFKHAGERICVGVLRKLFRQIPFAGPDVDVDLFGNRHILTTMKAIGDSFIKGRMLLDGPVESDQVAVVHKMTITPSGIYLDGPDGESNNRVLRKYAAHQDHFLKMQFCDEDGSLIQFNRDLSNAEVFKRFESILATGVKVAGRHFSFLGHSHSSVFAQACWAVAPFTHDGIQLDDRGIIAEIGDFSIFRCPARCAARIGQAFSDTRDALALDTGVVRESELQDVTRNERMFSDGVGTISLEALKLVWEYLYQWKKQPTVLQIRYRGAKGMLSLDTRLLGTCIFLRPSMTKFTRSNSNNLEICSAGHKPNPLNLNQQVIKILEDLGVPPEIFLYLQAKEINRLRLVTSSTGNAAQFLKINSIGEKTHLPWFFNKLFDMDLAFQDDSFLTDVIEAAVLIQLRELKYKARIPVKDGFTLLGVMDETGILEEGQVFCIADVDGESEVFTGEDGGRVVITRSPALHPGDVQLAMAVRVPEDSPLMKLRNCICFSQKGSRDLPSMLSGGDLDGDDYHIFFDPEIRPPANNIFPPADYPRQKPVELTRPVEKRDMIKFFVNFMEADQLGRISNAHKMLADQSEQGVKNPKCIKLAEMASTAVDYSKTGREVDMTEMPLYSPYRPHFMAPGPNVEIMENKPISFNEMLSNERDTGDDDDAPIFRYYRSKKILGKLFDAIDEKKIFNGIKQTTNEHSSHRLDQNRDPSESMLLILWRHILDRTENIDWKSQVNRARGIRDEYEDGIIGLMHEYGPRPRAPLSEIEVFIGNILGGRGAMTPRQRQLCMSMREGSEDVLVSTIKWMTGKHPEDDDFEEDTDAKSEGGALGASIACLWLALNESVKSVEFGRKGKVKLRSFGYVAAIVCLKEMQRAGL